MNNASVSYPKCTPGDLPHIKPTGPASNCINEMDVGPIRPSMDGGQTGRCSDTRSTPPIRPHCVSSYCFAWRNNRSTPPPVRAVWIEPLHMHTREWLVYADRHTHTHVYVCMWAESTLIWDAPTNGKKTSRTPPCGARTQSPRCGV